MVTYTEIKSRIEEVLDSYNANGLAPAKFTVEKKGSSTEIKFDCFGADMYDLSKILLRPLDDVKTSTSCSSLLHKTDNIDIWLHSMMGNGISYAKKGEEFLPEELESVIEAYKTANPLVDENPEKKLANFGVHVYQPDEMFSWDYIAGYEDVKEKIKDSIILCLKHPEVYADIAKGTRKVFESNKPNAMLFEGEPGTGKTTMARVIASEVDVPLIYVPVESIMTKWYGESERNLAGIFDVAHNMGNSILFLDEIDSLAASRDGNMHEATRRVLSVLLRKIDGFESNDKTLMIGATNRKNDLDAALLSRFDQSILFRLPLVDERLEIFKNYAKQLSLEDLQSVAKSTEGMSGRNIKDICEQAERTFAAAVIQNRLDTGLPSLLFYMNSIKQK